ncbi:MAG: hypothetical protein P4L99_21795 [Chthoniobacter sp.]|nr:hypothetical protein [Chthoniobacter sp.]
MHLLHFRNKQTGREYVVLTEDHEDEWIGYQHEGFKLHTVCEVEATLGNVCQLPTDTFLEDL